MEKSKLHDWDAPVVLDDGTRLSNASGRIDLLVPILALEGEEEDFLLDLHYSYLRPRVWSRVSCGALAGKLGSMACANRALILAELSRRVPGQDAEAILREWIRDLESLATLVPRGGSIGFTRPARG
jgi:hypothetical protein